MEEVSVTGAEPKIGAPWPWMSKAPSNSARATHESRRYRIISKGSLGTFIARATSCPGVVYIILEKDALFVRGYENRAFWRIFWARLRSRVAIFGKTLLARRRGSEARTSEGRHDDRRAVPFAGG